MEKIYYGKIKRDLDVDVVLNDLKQCGCLIRKQFSHMKTFITFSSEISIDVLKKLSHFEHIEEIFHVSLHGLSQNNRSFNTYYNWGLDRICKPTPVLLKNFDATRTGKNTHLYIMDTGIMMSHVEFNGRAYALYDAFRTKPRFPDWRWWTGRDPSPYINKDEETAFLASDSAYYAWPGIKAIFDVDTYVPDDHGTHVAAIAAGNWCGVASDATVWSIRIFDENNITTNEHVLDGVNAIIAKHVSMNPSLNTHDLSTMHLDQCGVVNMSFGGPNSPFWDTITNELMTNGLVVVVSAGNNSQCASIISPAAAGTSIDLVSGVLNVDPLSKPICVGSSMFPAFGNDYPDVFASWSNWGDVIDIIAPGDGILSASFDLTTDNKSTWDVLTQYRQRTGSSQSAPFAAGVACLILETGSTRHGPDGVAQINNDVRTKLVEYSYPNMFDPQSLYKRVDGHPRSTPNNFLYSFYIETDVIWDDGNAWEITTKDDTSVYFYYASSTDPFGLNVRISYRISNMFQYKENQNDPDFAFPYKFSTSRIDTDRSGFFNWIVEVTLAPPLTSLPLEFGFDVIAGNGRRDIQKRVLVHVLARGESLKWNYPDDGLISPLDSRYQAGASNPNIMISNDPENEMYISQVVYQEFNVSDVNLSSISYQVIPSIDYLPPGLSFSQYQNGNDSIGVVQGSVGIIPKNVLRYDFVIRAKNAYGIMIDRSFFYAVQPTNLLHRYSPTWLGQIAVDSGYEVQENNRVYYLADLFQGGQLNIQLEINNPDNDILSYDIKKIKPSSLSDGTTRLSDWTDQFVPTPYYDANCDPNVTTCFSKFTNNKYYRLTATQLNPTPLNVYDGILPKGLTLGSDGIISGIVDLNANVGLYYFKIMAKDGVYGVTNFDFYEQITCSFRIQINPISFKVVSTNVINWITNIGNIGDVWEMYPSHLRVQANTIGSGTIEYNIIGTSLPDGLTLNIWSGYIIGISPSIITKTQVVSFTVRASIATVDGVIFNDRTFSFTIHSRFTYKNFMNFVFPVMGSLRKSIMRKIWIEQYVALNYLFQPSAFDYLNDKSFKYDSDIKKYKEDFIYPSPVFGVVRYPSIYVVGGLTPVDPNLLVSYLKNYHHRIKLVLGKLNYATATDPIGNDIYDVIYFDVIDANQVTITKNTKVSGGFDYNNLEVESDYPYTISSPHKSIINVPDPSTNSTRDVYFEQSIRNMRLDLITTTNRLQITTSYNGIGYDVIGQAEGFPSWMETTTNGITVGGFKLAMPVVYVQPGKGQQVLNLLKTKLFHEEFLGEQIDVNGYVISGLGFGAGNSPYIVGSKYFKFT